MTHYRAARKNELPDFLQTEERRRQDYFCQVRFL